MKNKKDNEEIKMYEKAFSDPQQWDKNLSKLKEDAERTNKKFSPRTINIINAVMAIILVLSIVLFTVFILVETSASEVMIYISAGLFIISIYFFLAKLEDVDFVVFKKKKYDIIQPVDMNIDYIVDSGQSFDCYNYIRGQKPKMLPEKLCFSESGVVFDGKTYSYEDTPAFFEVEYRKKVLSMYLTFAICENKIISIIFDKQVLYFVRKYDVRVENDDELDFFVNNQEEALKNISMYGHIL